MEFNVYKYDKFINNIKSYVSILSKKEFDGCIILASHELIEDIELLGVSYILEEKINMYRGLNCIVNICFGKYIEKSDMIKIEGEKKDLFSTCEYVKIYRNISKELSKREIDILKENEYLICIEYNNKLRKVSYLNNILNKKKDLLEIYLKKENIY